MHQHKKWIFMSLVLAVAIVAWSFGNALAKDKPTYDATVDGMLKKAGKITPTEQKAAASRAKALGLKPGVAATAVQDPKPGGVPHYFGPYGNWAYSPLPKGPVTVITVDDGGTGYTAPVVTIDDAYLTIALADRATATATVLNGAISGFTNIIGGVGYTAPIVTITDPTGTGASASATIGGVLTGGIRKFQDRMPGLTPAGANLLVTPGPRTSGQYIPIAAKETVTISGQTADYYEIALVEYNERMHTDLPPTRQRGYVQLSTPTNLGAQIPLLNPADGITPILKPDGSPAIAVDYPHALGPLILATGTVPGGAPGVPVRVKYYNLLPVGPANATGHRPGDLFLPVDETVMGSGSGPMAGAETYTQNRSSVHLHGHNGVWISDGTTHQWITPAGETTSYPKGVSVYNVPDMPNPGKPPVPPAVDPAAGTMTFFYTNAQSARLMFYHDHAMGLTRLNVYAGEAAGYVLTDQVETDMIAGTNVSLVNPGGLKVLPGIGIPLVIQDKTFVDATTIFAQDPTWNWGTGPRDPATGNLSSLDPAKGAVTGDLWYPHVYMSAQNPYDISGTNAFGRWHYGPWFWPPVVVDNMPVANPYYQSICDGVIDPANPTATCTAPWEPPMMPGTPNPSMAGEAFMDTPVVNGTAYPYLEVEPKAYRFRILNGSDDRFLNLQLYVAADKTTPTTPGTAGTIMCNAPVADVTKCTEVKMVATTGFPNQLSDWPSGVPDPAYKGPDWIQIGTEGGFLPAPAVIPSQPIGWNLNPTTFNYGNVNQHSLLLGTAERADVVVDFSAFAGKTLILYNDASAAFPAGVPVYDYYTGTPNQMDTGGAPTTQPGYGPNTRTIMQIRVAGTVTGTPTTGVTLANLQSVFAKTAAKGGVFESSHEPIIMPQAPYNSAYNPTPSFPSTPVRAYVSFIESVKTFYPINADGVVQPTPITIPLEPKAMHDEMGGVYDTSYGRMSGMLGLDNPHPTSTAANFLAYGYGSPPVDIIAGSVSGSQIGLSPDGTQIWKITHNGVDTHTIHVHLFNAQLINRIAMDGIMLVPEPNELGWKDTFRVNPLEHTIIAMRPIIPTAAMVPFPIPNSVRLIDPTLPAGVPLNPPPPAGWFDPAGNGIAQILNHEVNYGWEYVWHCHILAHEEMDMMHSLVFAVPPETAPTLDPTTLIGTGNNRSVRLTWSSVANASNYTVQRSTTAAFTPATTTAYTLGKVTTYDNFIGNPNQTFWYRVIATNTVGDTVTPGFPTETIDSLPSNVEQYTPPPPADPTVVTAVRSTTPINSVTVTWVDNATNETGYRIQWATNAGFTGAVISTVGAGITTFTTGTLLNNTSYYFRVQAFNASTSSALVNATPFPITTPAMNAPSSVTAVRSTTPTNSVTVTWVDNATNETGYRIQRATNAGFNGAVTSTVGAGVTTFTTGTLLNNTSYYFRVQAFNASTSSALVNATPLPITTPAMNAPSSVTAVNTNTPQIRSVRVTWVDNATNETGYRIQRATNPGFTGAVTSTVGAGITTFNSGTLTTNTNYYFRVQAFNATTSSALVNAAPFPILTP